MTSESMWLRFGRTSLRFVIYFTFYMDVWYPLYEAYKLWDPEDFTWQGYTGLGIIVSIAALFATRVQDWLLPKPKRE